MTSDTEMGPNGPDLIKNGRFNVTSAIGEVSVHHSLTSIIWRPNQTYQPNIGNIAAKLMKESPGKHWKIVDLADEILQTGVLGLNKTVVTDMLIYEIESMPLVCCLDSGADMSANSTVFWLDVD